MFCGCYYGGRSSPHGVEGTESPVMAWFIKVLNCYILVSEFEIKKCYYIHFWTNNLGKVMDP